MRATRGDDRELLPKELQQLLDSVAAGQSLEEYTVEVSTRPKQGDNFMSDIIKARMEGRRHEERVTLPLVVKRRPLKQHELIELRTANYFANELAMYGEVLTFMMQFHEQKIPGDERFLGVSRFYGGFYEGSRAALALQDMSAEGYRLADYRKGLDAAHARLVLREMGRLHALSFALRDQHPDKFEHFASLVRHEVFVREVLVDYLRGMTKNVATALLNTFPQDSLYVRRFRESIPDLTASFLMLVTREAAEPYAVIGHGDCWGSNYLFKYSDDGETPVATCLVDLQISRCSSPINDLAYFICAAAIGSIGKHNYESFMSEYYSSMSEYLRQLGTDPDRMFPLRVFKDHQRRFMKFGLCIALMYTPFFIAPPGTILDVEWIVKHPEDLGDLLSQQYVQRVADAIVLMVDHDFI